MNIASLSGVAKVAAGLAGGGVLAGVIALGATGGGSGGSAPPAQVVEVTPTSVPERTSDTRLDPTKPRTDCPDGWTYYNDPNGRFSFCYPDDFKLVTTATVAGVTGPWVGQGNVAVWFFWMGRGNSERSLDNVCSPGGGRSPWTSMAPEVRAIAGRSAAACFTDTYADQGRASLDYRSFAAEFHVTTGGVIRANADYSASRVDELERIALAIIDTLLVR
jgi:hypothetical protein